MESSGFDIEKSELNPMLYEFQKDVVRWALKKGKACIRLFVAMLRRILFKREHGHAVEIIEDMTLMEM